MTASAQDDHRDEAAPIRPDAEYVLPLRASLADDLADLTEYLSQLVSWIDVTVVDGSEPAAFARHSRLWPTAVRQLAPTSDGLNGKARGVLTGIATARHPALLIADDDVRYDRAGIRSVLAALDDADLVIPQNIFSSWPWHARWDTGRQLLNRCFGGDFPGTLAVRRQSVTDGYDPDVLFENLELIRTVAARGGRVRRLDEVFVARRPPTTGHFWSQRVRQAYDSFGQPGRLAVELAVLPLIVLLRRRALMLASAALAVVALAERGRRRRGGAAQFPATAALWAPLWLGERAVCSWWALALRLRGGVHYSDGRIQVAAHSLRELRASAPRPRAPRSSSPSAD